MSEICQIDGCPIEICGGPHKEVFTGLGWEIMKLDQNPIGVPRTPTEEEEQNRYSRKRKLMDTSGGLNWDGVIVGPPDSDLPQPPTGRTVAKFLEEKGLTEEYREWARGQHPRPA
jgi:hypothetical protein